VAGAVSDDGRPSLLERAVDRIPFLEKELFLLRRLVRPGDVCLDVGAAGGAHLFVMSWRAGRRGRVLGVEPRPGSYRLLRASVRLLGAVGLGGNVSLVQAALAEGTGTVTLRVPVVPTRAHLRGSSDDRHGAAAFARLPARSVRVPTRSLDDLVDSAQLGRVDVIKCDVEGAELLVLAGGERVLTTHRPVVVIEADDEHQRRFDTTAQDVLDALVAHGYRPHRYRRGRLEAVDGVVPDEDDYVLIPPERSRSAHAA
jgi:FkbM family methyltransferase